LTSFQLKLRRLSICQIPRPNAAGLAGLAQSEQSDGKDKRFASEEPDADFHLVSVDLNKRPADYSIEDAEIAELFQILQDYVAPRPLDFRNFLVGPGGFLSGPSGSVLCFSFLPLTIGLLLGLAARLHWVAPEMLWYSAQKWGLILALVGILGLQTSVILTIWSLLPVVFRPAREFLGGQHRRINKDREMLRKLRGFSVPALRYLQAHLRMEAEQLRSRISILVGALDKLGVIPLSVGWLYTAVKYYQEAASNIKGNIGLYLEISAIGLGVLYVLSIRGFILSHQIDKFAQALEIAAQQDDNHLNAVAAAGS